MTRGTHRLVTIAMATAVGIGCLFVSEGSSSTKLPSFVTTADARVGRPLTPNSVAGVARRTTRRAVAVGAAAAVGVGAAAAYGQRCQQVLDAYGRWVSQCY
jgi:hypothetical protein